MKAAIKAMRNKEMGRYEASRIFNLPQTTLQSYVKGRKETSSEAIKQNWLGSKFFLVKKTMIWLNTVCDAKKVFGLDKGRRRARRVPI